jgi:hypothetical protein
MPDKITDKKEMTNFLKSVIDLVNLANKNGVKDIYNKIKMFSVADVNSARTQIVTIITDEVSKHFMISIQALRFGAKYVYDMPRLITYKLLYTHTDMTIRDIATYFNKSEKWVQRKLASFKQLKADVGCDKETLNCYDKIIKSVSCRVTALTEPSNPESEDADE